MYIKKKPYIIAEAGVNHNGSLNLAKKLILGSKKAGADAIKFQSFITENLTKKNAPKVPYQIDKKKISETHYQMLKKLELSFVDQRKIFLFCKKLNIEFISTPFDVKSALFLKKIGVNIIKISSGDLTDLPLHKTISKFNKDVIISTGMSNVFEIKRSLNLYKNKKKISLLHCVSNYPSSIKNQNLNAIKLMKNKFRCRVGYSDHTVGDLASIIAVTNGAEIIEKHITLDNKMIGPDHKASMELKDFDSFVYKLKNIDVAQGKYEKKCQNEESQTRKISRKSLYFSNNLSKGHVLKKDDFITLRPAKGLDPFYIKKILNKKLTKNVKKFQIVSKKI
jgi:sialic acid synthase SpsE